MLSLNPLKAYSYYETPTLILVKNGHHHEILLKYKKPSYVYLHQRKATFGTPAASCAAFLSPAFLDSSVDLPE